MEEKGEEPSLKNRDWSTRLGLGWSVGWRLAGQFAEEKFLEKIGGGRCSNADEGGFKRQCRIAIRLWIVEIGDAACGEATEESGVIHLPVSIITFADNGLGDRIEKP